MPLSDDSPLWGTADAEIKVPSVENPELKKVLPLKPKIGQYIDMYATLTARVFFRANFYTPGPFTYLFSPKNLYRILPVLAMANAGSCVGPQNKIGHPARCYRRLLQVLLLSARRI